MYVEVESREPPEASLDGPDELTLGEAGTVAVVDLDPGTHPINSVVWFENYQVVDVADFDEPDATTHQVSDTTPGIQQIEAVIVDESGFRTTAIHEIVVGDDYAHFDVEILDASSPIEADEPLIVDARIENIGTIADTQYVSLVHATHADETTVSLGPGDATEVELGDSRESRPLVSLPQNQIEIDSRVIVCRPNLRCLLASPDRSLAAVRSRRIIVRPPLFTKQRPRL